MMKFVRVKVSKGRKFRGEAYDVGNQPYENTYQLPGWHRGGWISSCSVKLWSPSQGWVYANPSYLEPVDAPADVVAADLKAYTDFVVDGTVTWCRTKSAGKPEKEVLRFAHNVIKKHHSELLPIFIEKYGYSESVVDSVNSTMDWAFGLGYSNAKCVRIAVRVLTKKGIINVDAARCAANMYLDLRGLHHLAEKYIPVGVAA